jgi:hypothetical protein
LERLWFASWEVYEISLIAMHSGYLGCRGALRSSLCRIRTFSEQVLRTLAEGGSPKHLALRLRRQTRLVGLILWVRRREVLGCRKPLDHFTLLCRRYHIGLYRKAVHKSTLVPAGRSMDLVDVLLESLSVRELGFAHLA